MLLTRFMKKYTKYHGLILFFPRGCKIFFFVNIMRFVFGFYSALFVSGVGCESFKGKGRVLGACWPPGWGEVGRPQPVAVHSFPSAPPIPEIMYNIEWMPAVEGGGNLGRNVLF